MKQFFRRLSAVMTLAAAAFSLQATPSITDYPAPTQDRVDSVLQVLNAEIERAPARYKAKEQRIAALRSRLAGQRTAAARFATAASLYDEYKNYQSDSAMNYANHMYRYATAAGNPRSLNLARVALLNSYTRVGFFKEASEINSEIDPTMLTHVQRSDYYNILGRLYSNMESYVGFHSTLGDEYRRRRIQYYDSVMAFSPADSYTYHIARVDRASVVEEKAENNLLRIDLDKRFSPAPMDLAVDYSIVSHIFRDHGDRRNAIYYLALSAINDLRSCNRETTAAKDLAWLLHEEGDIQLSNKYIHLALHDAEAYNSRIRKVEINSVLPIIENTRYNRVLNQRTGIFIVVVAVTLLLLLICILFVKLRKSARHLSESHAEIRSKSEALEESNAKLQELNSQLKETSDIKDQYIIQSLYGNTDFVNDVDEKKTKALSRLVAKKYSDVSNVLHAIDIKGERTRVFSNFDKAFLKLFPNFIGEFNKMFPEEERFEVADDSSLTTELRIFALMRLGIDSATDVAKYLNLSVNTVYVYKTKVKSRSHLDKNEFDRAVMAIPKP